jgi:hypothetical protein
MGTLMSDVSKLPAWPPSGVTIDAMAFFMAERDAYRARMEALVEVVREYRDEIWKSQCEWEKMERIDALLAACEREEGR